MEIYKEFRPTTLDHVVGCDSTTESLRAFLAEGTLPHSILFHGPSGCGKTTLARILKDELECHDLDYRELNSASYRGIDSIRDIQQTMRLAPQAGPVRVWVLDEAHMLSKDAQNAALKILEDTPSHVYFFLCTTDSSKLITAVRTRPTEMPVRLLNKGELESILSRPIKKKKINLSKRIIEDIIESSAGSARTALVLLEKVAVLPEDKQEEAIQEKLAEDNQAIDLCRSLINGDAWGKVSGILANLKGEPETIRHAVLNYAKSVLLKGNQKDKMMKAYLVMDCFRGNFYDSHMAGVVYASFEAIHAK